MLVLNLLDPADPRADDGADPIGVFLGEIHAAVLHGLNGRGNRQLAETVHPLGVPFVDVAGHIEMLDFAPEMHGICTGVERFDRGDPTATFAQRIEKLVHGLGQSGDAPQARYNHSASIH